FGGFVSIFPQKMTINYRYYCRNITILYLFRSVLSGNTHQVSDSRGSRNGWFVISICKPTQLSPK
ncbi:MAG: hypothetical protein LBG58_05910, partial [Planctomycetaceae bacterium]|nr:hypothetical protein [Planctomycetaceae bacterium]